MVEVKATLLHALVEAVDADKVQVQEIPKRIRAPSKVVGLLREETYNHVVVHVSI